MNFKTKLGQLLVLSLIFAPTTWAKEHEEHNDCSRMHVQIGNSTEAACKLIKSKVLHGRLSSSPPSIVYPGMLERFDIHQTFRGPEIQLTYQCAHKKITISSQQNYCFMKAGQIHGHTISADPQISASYTKENGSWFWHKSGFINWELS